MSSPASLSRVIHGRRRHAGGALGDEKTRHADNRNGFWSFTPSGVNWIDAQIGSEKKKKEGRSISSRGKDMLFVFNSLSCRCAGIFYCFLCFLVWRLPCSLHACC